jgi:hypothetical protein
LEKGASFFYVPFNGMEGFLGSGWNVGRRGIGGRWGGGREHQKVGQEQKAYQKKPGKKNPLPSPPFSFERPPFEPVLFSKF